MKKTDWVKALKEIERLRGIAENNVKAAEMQLEELNFNISNYKAKIKTFK